HFALCAEGLQDHVTKHVRLGFRLADLTDIDQLLHERLVLRREANVVLANNVSTTVADLNQVETIATNSSASESRAHTCTTRVFLTLEMNRSVGVVSGVLQTFNQIERRIA